MTTYSDVPEAENEDLTTWSLQKLTSGMNIYVQVEGHINASRELQRIESKLKKLSATIDKLKVKGCTKPLSDNENAKYDATSTKWGDLILVYNYTDHSSSDNSCFKHQLASQQESLSSARRPSLHSGCMCCCSA